MNQTAIEGLSGNEWFVVGLAGFVIIAFWVAWFITTSTIRDEIQDWKKEMRQWRETDKSRHEELIEALKKRE